MPAFAGKTVLGIAIAAGAEGETQLWSMAAEAFGEYPRTRLVIGDALPVSRRSTTNPNSRRG